MSHFRHAPYAGGTRPFSIGLKPLDPATMFEPDARRAADVAEKDRLIAATRDVVWRELPESRAIQEEVLAYLADHLPKTFPEIYRRTEDGMEIAGSRPVRFADAPPLLSAARMVQEDLLVLSGQGRGHRLVAASVSFPSSWSLADKFGGDLDHVHAAVPGYESDLAVRMGRIFDNAKAGIPMWRLNWSLYPDAILHHPQSKQRPRDWFGAGGEGAYVRVERQTLSRLPETGAILFTVKILVDPVSAMRTHPDGRALASGLAEQIRSLNADQRAYKALDGHAEEIAAFLDQVAAEA